MVHLSYTTGVSNQLSRYPVQGQQNMKLNADFQLIFSPVFY